VVAIKTNIRLLVLLHRDHIRIIPKLCMPSGLGVVVTNVLKPTVEPADVVAISEDVEPEFQTPKERECWQLYRRMLEKGVSVSYDTILRCGKCRINYDCCCSLRVCFHDHRETA
jgi:hypothetical protein